jgi:polysaccharide biosynthesis/export protein
MNFRLNQSRFLPFPETPYLVLRCRLAKFLNFKIVAMMMIGLLAATGRLWASGSQPADAGATTSSPNVPTNIIESSISNIDIPDDVPTNSMDSLDDKYKLAIGDRINFQVLEDGDDPKTLAIMDSGDIEVPYIGRYPAAGKTCKELAQQLKVELEKKYYYRATVIISVDSMVTKGVIYLVGAVRSPGPLEIPRDEVLTVGKAILRVGGFTDFADEKHVRVTRKGENGTNDVFTLDVSEILDKGKTGQDQPVEPGDLIYVPDKVFRF